MEKVVLKGKTNVDISDLAAEPALPDDRNEPADDSYSDVDGPEPEPVYVEPVDRRFDGLEPGEDFITAQTTRFLQLETRRDKFPHVVGNLIPPYDALKSMSIRELDDLVRSITFRIKVRNSNMMIDMFTTAGFAAIETAGPFVGLQLQGYANVMSQDPRVKDLVNEIMLDYEKYVQVDPKIRLLVAAATNARAVHNYNVEKQNAEAAKMQLSQPARDLGNIADL